MTLFHRFLAVLTVSLKRLWAQKGLTVATLAGLVAGVAMIMAVPLYADAVNFRVLQEELSRSADRVRKPPFAFLYDYVGAWAGPVGWDDTRALDTYLRGPGAARLGLPLTTFVTHFESDSHRLFPAGAAYNEDQSLGAATFATAENLADHITLTSGAFPRPAGSDPAAPVEVLVSEERANELGLQVGDELIMLSPNEAAAVRETPVRVAGTWTAADPDSEYWYFPPDLLVGRFFVPVETFRDRIAAGAPDAIDRATWYLVADGRGITTENVAALSANATAVVRQVENLLPGARNAITPVDGLRGYQRAVAELTVLLAAFNVPVITLVLAFIVLITGLAVDQRRNEIAVMRSRGATPWQVVGFAVVESLVLGVAALALGALLALALTHLMGQTRTFLDFSADYRLRVALTRAGVRAGLLAVGLALVAQVLPTLSASRETIISYKQEQARTARRPWWQRAWLDALLFLVTLYGFYLLRQQGSILAIGAGAASGDPFRNPLLFVLPSLAVFSLALLFLRVFPWLMEAFGWLLDRTDSVGLLLGGRQLARAPRGYAMPLLLLVLTVSLAAFSASLARTLDLQLTDALYYRTGSDIQLTGAGVDFTPPGPFQEADADTAAGGLFLPMDEYLALPGVEAAARVGRYPATASVGQADVPGTYLGIDRTHFPAAAFWRYDFAGDRLGALMNALAAAPEGLLVSRDFLAERGLRPGEWLRLNVTAPDGVVELDAQIAGVLDYFPTWYAADDGPLFVGNLETLFAGAGGDMAYEVWLRTGAPPETDAFDTALRGRGLFGWRYVEPHTAIARELGRPERQGLFGQLSVGFITAALLTVLGFFLYALFSFRQRLITLGILRAVGMSLGQMGVLVAFELGVLILSGLTLGALLGVWISRLFIPYLQLGEATADLVPPYLVEIAWPAIYQIFALFVLLFLLAVGVLTLLLRRMRLFQAIKLGETA